MVSAARVVVVHDDNGETTFVDDGAHPLSVAAAVRLGIPRRARPDAAMAGARPWSVAA